MVDDPLVESHLAWLSAQLTPAPLLVGYSGGLDSHVLLLWLTRFVARHPEFSLQAVHVHHGLNALADKDQFTTITRRINGGLNGLEQRMQLWARAKAVLCGS